MSKIRLFTGYVLLMLLVEGCAMENLLPPSREMSNGAVIKQVSPDFNHENLWQGQMIVGGVGSYANAWSKEVRIALATRATRELSSKLHLIRLLPFERYMQSVGEENFMRYGDSIVKDGALDSNELEQLSKQLSGIRYVFFKRIIFDSNDRDDRTTATPDYTDGGEIDYSRTQRVNRGMRVEGIIYDLQRKKVAWTATSRFSLYRTSSYENDPNDPFGKQLADDIVFGGQLSVPSDEEMMDEADRLFTSMLPRTCDSIKSYSDCSKLKRRLYKEWQAVPAH
ncbi:hypothetical protein [Mariprofundus ferrooxydans]|uniref:Lipoprotein n=1 Tax=Mariprofundus ferrooxydans PV-1 TaxID=314345 RepID=Q0F2A8_9PROT|nr:hypothetical protein [Mariprofundus ferrooxydans]EAU55642.1 hypothetical protein SPV1_01802 [Mariprofundus ferrooxydans PV-1]KON48628.1 hypothetical protein AL013_01245 [Mariprofundus ferrooxydans]